MTCRLGVLLILTLSGALLPSPERAWAASKSPGEQSERQRAADGYRDNPNYAPLQVRIVDDEEQTARRRAGEQAAQRHETDELEIQRTSAQASEAQAVFGFLAMVLLFLTLVYTARAANAAKRSADHANIALEHTISAVRAATRSADAAEEAVKVSREELVISTRPYIVAEPVTGLRRKLLR